MTAPQDRAVPPSALSGPELPVELELPVEPELPVELELPVEPEGHPTEVGALRWERRPFVRLAALVLLMVVSATASSVLPWSPASRWALLAGAATVVLLLGFRLVRGMEQRRRAELDRLLRTSRHQAEVVWAVSHELRNPLTMIKASAALLASQSPGSLSVTQARFVRVIEQQTQHGIAICDDLLVQARLDSGTFRLVRRPTDVVRLARDVSAAAGSLLDQRGQRVVLDVPRLMDPVMIDGRAVTQALSNLLLNASRHSAEGTAIQVKVLDNETVVAIQVTDAGDGMNPAERARAFEPFSSGALGSDGTGLGLSITRRLVEAHGGRVLLDTRLRSGTAVMFTLPKVPL